MDLPIQWQDDWPTRVLAISAVVAAVSVIVYKTPLHHVAKWLWRGVRYIWRRLVGEPVGEWTKDVISQVIDEKITQPNGGSALVDKLIQIDSNHRDLQNDICAQLANIHECMDRRFADSHDAIAKLSDLAEQVLLESVGTKERLRQVYRSLELPVFEANVVGQFTYANPAFTKLTGLPPADALGEGWAAAIHRDDRDRVFHSWRQAVDANREFGVVFRLINRSTGATVEVHCSAVALHDGRGGVVGWVGTIEPLGVAGSTNLDHGSTNPPEGQDG